MTSTRFRDVFSRVVTATCAACVVVWCGEELARATTCLPDEFIGEIWEMHRVGAPHDEAGVVVTSEDEAWKADATAENVDFDTVVVDALVEGAFQVEYEP